jgi:TolB-like protein
MSAFWHRLRETVTHWFVGGVVLLVTGLVPEEWLAHTLERLHVSSSALHLWSAGLDVRVALALLGLALIVGDIVWRRRPSAVAGESSGTAPPSAPAAGGAIRLAAGGSAPAPEADATLALPSRPSVAVLPFANLSGDPGQDYFVDGMVVEIVEALARIRSIFVIGSGSTLSLKHKAASPREVGRQFGVRYVLEGNVRKAGNAVRIGVQLTDAADGVQIWTERFEDTLEDVFTLQDRVALAVAGKIEPTLEQAEIRRTAARHAESVDSYDLFLRALPLFRAFARSETLQALELLNRAIALDPENGQALALATSCHRTIVLYGWSDEPAENRRQGLELAARALNAAGDDASVLASVANDLAFLEGNVKAAVELVDRAVLLNPGSAGVWFNSGAVRLMAGDPDKAIEHLETAMRQDPTGPSRAARMLYVAIARFFKRQFVEAVALLEERNRMSASPGCFAFLAASHGHLGQRTQAREALERYRDLTPQPVDSLARAFVLDPDQLKLFLEGIARAEGVGTPDD